MKNRYYYLLTFFLILLTGIYTHSQAQTYTWTGNTDSDWTKSSNWTGASGTPGANSSVIIPNRANDPIISGTDEITINELQVRTGAVLNIESASVLNIIKSKAGNTGSCLLNDGTIVNRGGLHMTENGITTNGAFWNNGLFQNISEGNFDNSGDLTVSNVSGMGIGNGGTITNFNTAEITVSNTGGSHGVNTFGTFTNNGKLIITGVASGDLAYALRVNGATSSATFTNNANGVVDISDSTFGMLISVGGIMNNNGTILCNKITTTAIAMSSFSGAFPTFNNNAGGKIKINRRDFSYCSRGMNIESAFFNNEGGLIDIDYTYSRALEVDEGSTFRNEAGGIIQIGARTNNVGSSAIGIFDGARFINAACSGIINRSLLSELRVDDFASSTFTNNGWIQSYCNRNSLISSNFGTIVNYGSGSFVFDGGGNNAPIELDAAYSHVWIGAADNNWSNLCNWATNTLPNANSGVWVERKTFNPTLSSDLKIRALGISDVLSSKLTINSGVTLTVEGSPIQGVVVNGELENNGTLRIDNTTSDGLVLNKSTTIGGETYIGETGTIGGQGILTANGTTNTIETCALVHVYAPLSLNGRIINEGFLYVSTTASHSGTITNNSVLNFPIGWSGLQIINNDVIVAPFDLKGCGAEDVLDIGLNTYNTATSWYSDPARTNFLGIYDGIQNTLSLASAPSEGTQQVYFTINSDGCTFEVQTQYTLAVPANNTITWLGKESNEWTDPCNWNPAIVPTVNEDIVIPNRANDPIIRTGTDAVGKSLVIRSSAHLTIEFAASISIENSAGDGIYNQGTIDCHFSGVIGVVNASGNAIYNAGGTINTRGRIGIVDPEGHGLVIDDGTVSNNLNGALLFFMGAAPKHKNGIELLSGSFLNDFGAEVLLEIADGYGLNLSNGSFTNGGFIDAFDGDINFGANGTFNTLVNSASEYGEILFTDGVAYIDGTINSTVNYTPNIGDRIPFIQSANSVSGSFKTENLLPPWSTDYTVGSEVALVHTAALPVELIYFNIEKKEQAVLLAWQTATETNNEGFEVQHSTDGRHWNALGFVEGQGTTFEKQDYNFTHTQPSKFLNYYRLKQQDFDGQFEYSPIRSVLFNVPDSQIKVFPNPAQSVANVQLPKDFLEATIQIFDASGRQHFSQRMEGSQSLQNIDLSGWHPGFYLIKISVDGQVSTHKLQIQKA